MSMPQQDPPEPAIAMDAVQIACCKHPILNYVKNSLGSSGFNYAHSGMYSGCLWLSVASYGSLRVHGAPLWSSAHLAHVPAASLSPSEQKHSTHRIFLQGKTELSLPMCLGVLDGV